MKGAVRRAKGGVLFWLGLYGVSMAYLEAAVVVYLRRIYYGDNMLELFPLRVWEAADLLTELGREAATLVMILAVAALASRGFGRRLAAFFFIFGVWDIFYYVWLKVLIGWPTSWLEWDILFLIPWAWLAPWTTPAAVAFLFTLWGGWALTTTGDWTFDRRSAGSMTAGALIVLGAFLAPAFPLLGKGPEALKSFEPGTFLWGPWSAGFLLMAAGAYLTTRSGGRERR